MCPLENHVRKYRLRWAGHVSRMDNNRLPKKLSLELPFAGRVIPTVIQFLIIIIIQFLIIIIINYTVIIKNCYFSNIFRIHGNIIYQNINQ